MIAPITSSISIPVAPSVAKAAGAGEEFHNLLSQSISAVEQKRTAADAAVNRFLTGDTEELHTAALAGQRAELSLELFLQVRNKVVSAYQEVMRMQM
jgi:flagellar hook-basal body complex protein FliE